MLDERTNKKRPDSNIKKRLTDFERFKTDAHKTYISMGSTDTSDGRSNLLTGTLFTKEK